MNTITRFTLSFGAALLASAGAASAQQYAITWYSIDGGGAMFTTGGSYSLGSTIGQADAGPTLAAAGRSVVGGFWAGASSPSAPSCDADFNHDGNLDPDDLSDYINCYFAIPPCGEADFNSDGNIDPDDLGDYINAYFAGCP